jgi:hypothetical protein
MNIHQPTAEIVHRVMDAQGGHCATCDTTFNITTSPYWSWTKSVAMHRDGTGHKVDLYRLVAA